MTHSFSSYSNATLQATPRGLERFRNTAFGVSVHFGLWSVDGEKEWIQCLDRIDRKVYADRRLPRFNPTRFNADAWVEEFVRCGATAFLVTTKHHDGFCLFESQHTDFTSVHAPCKRDLIGELAEACRKRQVDLHLYHSLLDWHHPGMSSVIFEPATDFAGYVQFMNAQLSELLTNYGPIASVLFDGWWPAARATTDQAEVVKEDRWPYGAIYDHIHRHQPDCVVINNHHVLPLAGEDAQVWEIDLPGENTTGFNCTQIGDKPLMAWMTMLSNGWSWQPCREDYVSTEKLRADFQRARAMGASYFQNIGPRGDGSLNTIEVELLRSMQVSRQCRANG